LFRSGNLILLFPCNSRTGGASVTEGVLMEVVLEISTGRRITKMETEISTIILPTVE
jgi:hypothetical protein